jgi:hypothetical protein
LSFGGFGDAAVDDPVVLPEAAGFLEVDDAPAALGAGASAFLGAVVAGAGGGAGGLGLVDGSIAGAGASLFAVGEGGTGVWFCLAC